MAERSGKNCMRGGETQNVHYDSDILSDRLLQSVASKFGQEWENVAISLNFSMNEVTQLKIDFKFIKEQTTNMLIKWRQRSGKEQGLIEELRMALTEQGRKDMADDLLDKTAQITGVVHEEGKPQEGGYIIEEKGTERVGKNIDEEKTLARKDSEGINDCKEKGRRGSLESQVSSEDNELIEILDMANEDFIETAVLYRAEQILKEKQILFITGQNGSGKTSLAYHLYCTIAEKVDDEIICGKIDEILENFVVEKSKVIFLDDVFGTLMVDSDAIDKWSKMITYLPKFRQLQADAGCMTYLIFCCRNDIMENISGQIPVGSVLDMSREYMEVSEKRKIFEKIWKKHNAKIDIPSYIYDFDFPENSHLGFWFCANFHARRYHSHGESFFEDPLDILSKEMKNLIDEHTIPQQLVEKLSIKQDTVLSKEPTRTWFKLLASDIGICRQFPEFFKLNVQECFQYQHLLLYEQIELHLATKDVLHATANLSLKGLHKITVRLPKKGRSRPAKNTRQDPLCLKSERDVCRLISRLIQEVKFGNVHEVCKHTLWKEDRCAVLLDEHIFKKGSHDVVTEILSTADTKYGENMLYWSTVENRTELCGILVKYLKNHYDIDDQREILSRGLIGACSVKKNITIVKVLILEGANVSYCHACHFDKTSKNDNDQGNKVEHSCPLDIAIDNDNNNHAITLLKNKAEIPHSTWLYWKVLHEAACFEDKLFGDPTFLEGLKLLFQNSNIENEAFSSLETNKYHQFLLEIKDSCNDVHEMFLVFAKHGFLSHTMLQAFLKCSTNINVLNQSNENVLHLSITRKDDNIDNKCKVI